MWKNFIGTVQIVFQDIKKSNEILVKSVLYEDIQDRLNWYYQQILKLFSENLYNYEARNFVKFAVSADFISSDTLQTFVIGVLPVFLK